MTAAVMEDFRVSPTNKDSVTTNFKRGSANYASPL